MIEKPLKSPVEVLFCPLWGGPNKELSWEPAKCQSPGSAAWLLPAYTHTAVGANSIAEARLCHQRFLQSLRSWQLGSQQARTVQDACSPCGSTIPNAPRTELWHQPASHEIASLSQEVRTFWSDWPLRQAALRGYFRILGDTALPLHLIGPRCSPLPAIPLPLAVRQPCRAVPGPPHPVTTPLDLLFL